MLVSNDNMHIDIKPYFCLAYRSILKYRGIRCFLERDLPNSFVRFSTVEPLLSDPVGRVKIRSDNRKVG